VLCDGHIFADHEAVPIEPEDSFLVDFGHAVVEECPGPAMAHEMAVLVIFPGKKRRTRHALC
jgi:hypothetical protein